MTKNSIFTTTTPNRGGKKILKKAALRGLFMWTMNANLETPWSRKGLYLETLISYLEYSRMMS